MNFGRLRAVLGSNSLIPAVSTPLIMIVAEISIPIYRICMVSVTQIGLALNVYLIAIGITVEVIGYTEADALE